MFCSLIRRLQAYYEFHAKILIMWCLGKLYFKYEDSLGKLYINLFMLAYGQHNLGLCGVQRPKNWTFSPVYGPLLQFWAFGPVFGPSAHFWGLSPQEGDKHTDKQTFCKYILVWYFKSKECHLNFLSNTN